MASSSTLGLRAREVFWSTSSARIIPRQPVSLATTCSFSTSQSRPAQVKGQTKRALDAMNKSIGHNTPSPKRQQAIKQAGGGSEASSAAISIVFPGTFIRPPLSQWPSGVSNWLRFLKYFLIAKGQERLQQFVMKLQSRPSMFKRALWKRRHAAAVVTAKALHRTMAEAFASGDKATIRRICVANCGTPLLAAIDSRPRGRRYGYELVKYTKRMFYPSIRASRIMPVARDMNAPIVRQVVVAISSRQRRVEYDDSPRGGGKIVPGSEKEVDVVENVVIGQVINPHTWQADEWRILGTARSTTLEDWEAELALTKEIEAGEAMSK